MARQSTGARTRERIGYRLQADQLVAAKAAAALARQGLNDFARDALLAAIGMNVSTPKATPGESVSTHSEDGPTVVYDEQG